MDKITLADVGTWIAILSGLIASCSGIYIFIKRALKSLFDIQTKELQSQLYRHEQAINRVDLENCKNFLVSFLGRVDREREVDEIEKERFWEQYEHYSSLGGNSYIKNKVEVLCKKGLL